MDEVQVRVVRSQGLAFMRLFGLGLSHVPGPVGLYSYSISHMIVFHCIPRFEIKLDSPRPAITPINANRSSSPMPSPLSPSNGVRLHTPASQNPPMS